MKQQYIDYIEKTVRSHCKELEHKTHNSTYHRYDYTYDEIHLEHILRTMGESYAIDGSGYFLEQDEFGSYNTIEIEYLDGDRESYNPQFNLSLSWKEQEEPVLKFLAETMGFNS